jgi:deazaflavin-dependent oxidoreductase (nitroreductase family)
MSSRAHAPSDRGRSAGLTPADRRAPSVLEGPGEAPELVVAPTVGPAEAPPAAPTAEAHPPRSTAPLDLPYGPFLRRTLPAIRRAFLVLNRWYVLPAIKAGLGPLHANPLTGSWMLLRTRGRRTGLAREAALGYALLDGAVYCSAGFGERTAWYQNLLADPRVEIVLPSGGFAGVAEPVRDAVELDRAWRALIRALGLIGRGFLCREDAPADELAAATANLPLVRIRVDGLATGPSDPGGRFWLVPLAIGAVWLAGRVRRAPRARRPARGGGDAPCR